MLKPFCLALCIAGISSVALHSQMPSTPPSDDARRIRLEQIASSYTKDNAFMGAVLVAQGDTLLLNKGYGQADLEWNIPNAPDVKFRLGSLTKQFTAALVLLLQQDGKLNVSDPVSKYLPGTAHTWEKITVANLLDHTSGIPNFTEFKEFAEWRMNPRSTDELIGFFRDHPLDFEPGSKFAYSNSNYEVLGAIIEKVSGHKYGDLLHTRLFEPLGMHDTGLDTDELILPRRAQGYTKGPQGLIRAVTESMTVPWAAGSMYSTTGDLLIWERALFGGKVLNAASLKQMTTPGKGDYGFGLSIRTQGRATVVEHGGGIEGFNTQLSYMPGQQLTVVVLSNVSSEAPGPMAGNLLKAVLGEPVALQDERKEIPVAVSELAKFVGAYQLSPSFVLTFTVENHQLVTQATGQNPLPVFYAGTANGHPEFFLKVVDAQIEFIPDASGKIVSLILHQGGRDQPATRQ